MTTYAGDQREGTLVKVYLVDDREVVWRGLIDLLCEEPELDVVGQAGSVAEAMLDVVLAGGSGDVGKDIKGMQLACAIKEVSAGRSLPDHRAAAALMGKLRLVTENGDGFSGLNDRERTLLDLLGEGLTNKQIADRMFLTDAAVSNYVSRLLAKLGMARPTQMVSSAIRLKRATVR